MYKIMTGVTDDVPQWSPRRRESGSRMATPMPCGVRSCRTLRRGQGGPLVVAAAMEWSPPLSGGST